MSAIPETSTAGPDIPIILDREVITRLVKGLLSILHPGEFTGPLSGAAKTKVVEQVKAYTFALSHLGLPNHWSAFAVRQTVHSIMERITPPDYDEFVQGNVTVSQYARQMKTWKQAVIDGIVDRYMGLTTEDYPEGLAPQDMPFWWQKKHPEVRESTTVLIMKTDKAS